MNKSETTCDQCACASTLWNRRVDRHALLAVGELVPHEPWKLEGAGSSPASQIRAVEERLSSRAS